jgi:hypothetical protein
MSDPGLWGSLWILAVSSEGSSAGSTSLPALFLKLSDGLATNPCLSPASNPPHPPPWLHMASHAWLFSQEDDIMVSDLQDS